MSLVLWEKTYHKVLAHQSHPLAVRVDTLEGVCTLHRLGSLLLDRFKKEFYLCFRVCVIKKICSS